MAGEEHADDELRTEATESPGRGASGISEEVLDLDHVFEVLAHPRRRYLLYTLGESDTWTLEDLAAKIAAFERDEPVLDVSEAARERVYVSLYHAHVPKLVDEGVVTFDDETGTISTGEHAEQVLAALAGAGTSIDATQETHAKEGREDD